MPATERPKNKMLRDCLLLLSVIFLLVGCDVNAPPLIESSKPNTPISDYETARKIFWRDLYSGHVTSLYCSDTFSAQQRRGYNIEHVFPMSWATNGLNCGKRKQCRQRSAQFNRIEADLHNLYPARVDVNKERSSYRFGEISGERRQFGRCDFEIDERARVAEPTIAVRGEVARAMFYMAYQYREQGLQLFDKQARLLLQWHKADPPSAIERQRNDLIERIQGNRNPFVDTPEMVEQVMRGW